MTDQPLADLEEQRARLFEQLAGWGIPAGQRQRHLPALRETELRLRPGGPSRPRAAVSVDPVSGWPHAQPPAQECGTGEDPRGGGELPGVPGGERADRGGQRGDLRGQAGPASQLRIPGRASRGKGGLRAAFAAEAAAEVERLASAAAGRWPLAGRPGGSRAGHPRGDGQARRQRAGRPAGRRPRLPRRPGGVRGWPPGGVRLLPGQDHRHRAGPVTLRRAWYHCGQCRHGIAPRDAELSVGQASMSPGLRR